MVVLHVSVCLFITEYLDKECDRKLQTPTSIILISKECHPVCGSLLRKSCSGVFSHLLPLESNFLYLALFFAHKTQCPYIENIKDSGILSQICLHGQYESLAVLRLHWMLSQLHLHTHVGAELYQSVVCVRGPTCFLLFCFVVIWLWKSETFVLHRAIAFS